MTRVQRSIAGFALCVSLPWSLATTTRQAEQPDPLLDDHLLITWYGNPRSTRMGILGEVSGAERAEGLRRQAAAYQRVTPKRVLPAYHVVAVVAQCTAGADGKWRRRETADVIQRMLDEARANGFKLVLDIQPGRSTVADEVAALGAFLAEPDVYLALDPEFTMKSCDVPGRTIGQLRAADVNIAIEALETMIHTARLPRKVLILHQFTLAMLPDKHEIRASRLVDVVLDMDGFGSQSLKRSTYRAIMRQGSLAYAGIKLFYRQDTQLFTPEEVMALTPTPSVVIYQ
ncbi:MAG: hypothetical protein JJE40_12625 [Vicinamibacteria bacterium]|nr:hypothetical protein [Vicinamibacteria bacterium]